MSPRTPLRGPARGLSKICKRVTSQRWAVLPWALALVSICLLIFNLVGRHDGYHLVASPQLADGPNTVHSAQGGAKDSSGEHYRLGKHMCILQPIKSLNKKWSLDNIHTHVGLTAFLPSFVKTYDPKEDRGVHFTIWYGYDAIDPALGNAELRAKFRRNATEALKDLPANIIFHPLYGLDGRLTAIWNDMAKTAYHSGCDYFFMSNDDMNMYTKGWASKVIRSFEQSMTRACRYLGIVRFDDKWSSWANFTFHVSSRLHMEIFNEVYYSVPYHNSHNDLWIHYTYKTTGSNFDPTIQVRNRVYDFSRDQPEHIEPPRYKYDKKVNFSRWSDYGTHKVREWISANKGSRCLPPRPAY